MDYLVNLKLSIYPNVYSAHTSKSQLIYSIDYMAPRNWNSLQDIVRLAPWVPTFRMKLKTYRFWQAFCSP